MRYLNILLLILMFSFGYLCDNDFKNTISMRSDPSQYRYYLNNVDRGNIYMFENKFGINKIYEGMSEEQKNNLFFFLRKQALIILVNRSKDRQFEAVMNIFALLNYRKNSFSKHNAFFLIYYLHNDLYRKIISGELAEFSGKKIFLEGIWSDGKVCKSMIDGERQKVLNVRLIVYEENVNIPYRMGFKMPYGIMGELDLTRYEIEDFDLPQRPTSFDLVSFFLNDKYFISFNDKTKLLEYWIENGKITVKLLGAVEKT